jgi:hypothetical protein
MSATKYLLDTNIFIEAKNRYYGFDICPGFWRSISWQHEQDSLYSIDKVGDELKDGNDLLKDWVVDKLPSEFFLSTRNTAVSSVYGKTLAWVMSQTQFTEAAKTEYANDVDGWLIAYAKANGFVLVTHEAFDPNIKKRVPIPNVCKPFGVRCVDTFGMLRELDTNFEWQPPKEDWML